MVNLFPVQEAGENQMGQLVAARLLASGQL